MIEINLLPADRRPKAAPKFVVPQIPIIKTFVALAGFVFVLQLALSSFAVYKVISLRQVKAQLASLTVESSAIIQKKADILVLQNRLKKIQASVERKYSWASLLNALTHSTTKGVWLTGFSVIESKVEISKPTPKSAGSKSTDTKKTEMNVKILKLDGSTVGQGEETAFTGKFIKGLQSNPVFRELFSDIELSNLTQKKIRDFDVYDFSIYCTFKPNKAPSS